MDARVIPVSTSDAPSLASLPCPNGLRVTDLSAWLQTRAEQLDLDRDLASDIIPQLGRAGVLGIGVPTDLGGSGGTILDAIDAVATVAEDSLAAALVFWGQRAFIECLLQGDNAALRSSLLPALVSGELAGAVGLSNAMKFLANMEGLQISAAALPPTEEGQRWTVNGNLPWLTNLRREGFVAAIATEHAEGQEPSIFAVPHDIPGVTRCDDLDLIGLRASNTAGLCLKDAVLEERFRLTSNAPDFLAHVRPNFLALQCGLSIGLARRSLSALDSTGPAVRAVIASPARVLEAELHDIVFELRDGISTGDFVTNPTWLFRLRLLLAAVVDEATVLEVQATGGRGFVRGQADVARRRREAAFIPVVTPSVVQLKGLLDK
ncbi:hypothetical protein LMG28614_00866 [Paraburkholderia ultramafica]|uniref:Acyl-CoA dehydrogenase/oxidase N-terminal domain-containing protein n=1 Tax=Paraburkholderia ultramafica TaxID=1544867 RepID=A0A6S7AVY1_9BURK|nr:acyl-CoA dehydrogenase family protein [Paraburkholderia ultramafica]CAB3779542.1 hypothetical protein LMG28614_00866 [Paraburkholderia ultramafica]